MCETDGRKLTAADIMPVPNCCIMRSFLRL